MDTQAGGVAQATSAEVKTATDSSTENKSSVNSSTSSGETENTQTEETTEENFEESPRIPKSRLNKSLEQTRIAREEARQAREESKQAREELEVLKKTFEKVGQVFTPSQAQEETDFDPEVKAKLNPLIAEEARRIIAEERHNQEIKNRLDDLVKKYDGSDGRPKFDTQSVIKHMIDNQIVDPEKAYKDKFEAELDDWKIKQAFASKKSTFSEKSTSSGDRLPSGHSEKKGSTKEQFLEYLRAAKNQEE